MDLFASEFREFPKIARLSRNMVVTEKIDGTNAQIFIEAGTRVTHPRAIAHRFDEATQTERAHRFRRKVRDHAGHDAALPMVAAEPIAEFARIVGDGDQAHAADDATFEFKRPATTRIAHGGIEPASAVTAAVRIRESRRRIGVRDEIV